jgi:hypothetical protein
MDKSPSLAIKVARIIRDEKSFVGAFPSSVGWWELGLQEGRAKGLGIVTLDTARKAGDPACDKCAFAIAFDSSR